jgi:S-formylglutathione hydrolase FrmB
MTRLSILVLALLACGKDAPAPKPTAKPESAPPAQPVAKDRAKSQVLTESFRSEALGVDKDVVIYLPAGYDAADARRYPVFYYLNGLGGDETNWVQGMGLDKAADTLGLEAIVVMPDGDNNFYIDSSLDTKFDACMKDGEGMFISTQPRKKTCVKASKYETYLTKDLINFVDGRFKTIPTREARAIAGLSMGGFGALVLSMRNPQLFGAVASHSGLITPLYRGPYPYEKGKVELHTSVASLTAVYKHLGNLGPWVLGVFGGDLETWRAHDPTVLAQKLAPGALHMYLDCGTEDEFLFHHATNYLHDLLLERGIKHEFYMGPGHHSFDFWRERLPKSLAFLRERVAKPQ